MSVEAIAGKDASSALEQSLEEDGNDGKPSSLPTVSDDNAKHGPLMLLTMDNVVLSDTDDQPAMMGENAVKTCLVGVGTTKAAT